MYPRVADEKRLPPASRTPAAVRDGRGPAPAEVPDPAVKRLDAPVAEPVSEAVSASRDTSQENQDRGDDADDAGQAKRDANRVDQSRNEHGDQNADHFDSLRIATVFLPPLNGVPCRSLRDIPRTTRQETAAL